jgi:hypothetical protein
MFKWASNDEPVKEIPKVDLQTDVNSVKYSCNAFCNKDNPACVGRGKHDTEVKLCWETMKDLRYSAGHYHISDQFYNHFVCSECQDNYIVKCDRDESTDNIHYFKCLICRG